MNYKLQNTPGLQMGIFGFSIHEKIAAEMLEFWPIPGYSKRDWINTSQSILPVYQDAVRNKGYKTYRAGTPGGARTLNYVIGQTGFKPGIVTAYLMQLENMATAGSIDADIWNPRVREAQKATSPLNLKNIMPDNGIEQSIIQPLDKLTTKVLVIGGISVIAYLLLKEGFYGKKRTAR